MTALVFRRHPVVIRVPELKLTIIVAEQNHGFRIPFVNAIGDIPAHHRPRPGR